MADTAPPFEAPTQRLELRDGVLVDATETGAAHDMRGTAVLGFQLSVTGGVAPSFALKIQHADRPPTDPAVVWRDLPGCAFTAIVGNVEEWKEPTQAIGGWIRYVLTRTSGTITFNLAALFKRHGPARKSFQGTVNT